MRVSFLLLCVILVSCSSRTPVLPTSGSQLDSVTTPEARGGYHTIYAFKGNGDGADPEAALSDLNGILYGTTAGGGTSGAGTVYQIDGSGAESVLYSFEGRRDGATPTTSLTAVKGELYGTTNDGGGSQCFRHSGCGTVFKITTTGQERVMYRFVGRDGAHPDSPLIYVKGRLYGTTDSGGAHHCGAFFSIGTSGDFQVIYSFKGIPDGCQPNGNLAFLHGWFYGSTRTSGAYTAGAVFKVNASGKESILHSFGKNARDGFEPQGGVVALNGALYGTTFYGGAHHRGLGNGSVFAITTSGSEHVLCRFTRDSKYPASALLVYKGLLYGTTYGQFAGANQRGGSVFRVTPSGARTILHVFPRARDDRTPAHPDAGLIAVDSLLYGTTSEGGGYGSQSLTGAGVVFAIKP